MRTVSIVRRLLCTHAVIFRVYCADHTYCTLRYPFHTTAEVIKASAADKLSINRPNKELALVEVKSNGERTVYKDLDVSVASALYFNGRIFVSAIGHIDALVSLQCFSIYLFLFKSFLCYISIECCRHINVNHTFHKSPIASIPFVTPIPISITRFLLCC